MATRMAWLGVVVGALIGGIGRVILLAIHFPGSLGDSYLAALIAGGAGIVIGGVAAATGRFLIGAVVGAALSLLFYLLSLPLVGLLASLGAATPASVWEMLAVGAIPGAIGGAVGQMASKRKGSVAAH